MERIFGVGVLVLAGLGSSACGGDDEDEGGSGPAWDLCEKLASCEGADPSNSEMKQCEDMVQPMLLILPDPDAFQSCVKAASCEQLSAQGGINTCIDMDTSSLACNGDALHACTNAGVCKDIDCRSACSLAGGSYMSCGYSSSEGYDQCLCSQ